MEVLVKFIWDDEARVWVATSEDVPGLVLESGSLDELMTRTRYAIPELLELNNMPLKPFKLIYRPERDEMVALNG